MTWAGEREEFMVGAVALPVVVLSLISAWESERRR